MMNEPIASIMVPREKLITHRPEDSMVDAQKTMKKYRLHHLPIVEGDSLKGLITTTDLLQLNRRFEEYEGLKVKDVMTKKLAKLERDAKVGTAATIFLENLFHLLPIVDETGKLLGIVTTFDVLKYHFKKEYPGDNFPFL
jgi:CBS domain-containing protein